MARATPFDPKVSSVDVQYIGNPANNLFYWTDQFPWKAPYPGGQTTTEMSPKGSIKYPDGSSPTAP